MCLALEQFVCFLVLESHIMNARISSVVTLLSILTSTSETSICSNSIVEHLNVNIRDIDLLEFHVGGHLHLVLLVKPAEADYVIGIFLDGELGSAERGKHVITVLFKYGKGLHPFDSPGLLILLYFSIAKLAFFVAGVLVIKKSLC